MKKRLLITMIACLLGTASAAAMAQNAPRWSDEPTTAGDPYGNVGAKASHKHKAKAAKAPKAAAAKKTHKKAAKHKRHSKKAAAPKAAAPK